MKHEQDGFGHLAVLLLLVVVAMTGFAAWRVAKNQSTTKTLSSSNSSESKAITAGKSLSANYCQGSGDATFTHLPMNASDFSLMIPYGQTVAGHVTPIDHQYFSPTNFFSARDTYPVFAMADARVVDIEPRYTPGHGTDYRLIFAHSCTFLYYYDLVTGLTPKLKQALDAHQFNIPVKAGDQIGSIGGQTLDFAVWNTQKPLAGFVNPASYSGEAWKIYTADPFPYYTPSLRQIVESKDPRTAEPIAGKIDYDIDGKLIGNWFIAGSGGYSGNSHGTAKNYSSTHLSIAPDLYDPSVTTVSVGNFDTYPKYGSYSLHAGDGSDAEQFFALAGSPDPANINQSSGAVKIELVQRTYVTPSGTYWNNFDPIKGLKAKSDNTVLGTVLAQLTAKRTLRFEAFPGKTAAQVSGFDENAKTYTR